MPLKFILGYPKSILFNNTLFRKINFKGSLLDFVDETHGIEEAILRIHPLQKKGKKKGKKGQAPFFSFLFSLCLLCRSPKEHSIF